MEIPKLVQWYVSFTAATTVVTEMTSKSSDIQKNWDLWLLLQTRFAIVFRREKVAIMISPGHPISHFRHFKNVPRSLHAEGIV